MFKLNKNQKGFTLVELIVVIAILGILAVISITRFGGITENARRKADTATAAQLAGAAQLYIASSPTAIKVPKPTGYNQAVITVDKLVSEGIIDEPKKPQTFDGKWIIKYKAATHEIRIEDESGGIWYPAVDPQADL